MAKSKDYYNYIDVAKGIGIIFIVLGHTKTSMELTNILYSFHIPLFYFILGVNLNYEKLSSFRSFTDKAYKSSIKPYFFFFIISITLYTVYRQDFPDMVNLINSFFKANVESLYFNRPLWFFSSLFSIYLLIYISISFFGNKSLIIVLFTISALYYPVESLIEAPNFLSFKSAIIGSMFVGFGILYKLTLLTKLINISKLFLVIFAGISALILIFSSQINGRVDIAGGIVNNPFLFLTNSIIGIIFVFSVAGLIRYSKLLELIGKQSLIIFAVHALTFPVINAFFYKILNIPFLISSNIIISLLYTSISILMCLIIGKFLKKSIYS